MAHEQIELGDALQRLMQECQNHTYCDKCPLYDKG